MRATFQSSIFRFLPLALLAACGASPDPSVAPKPQTQTSSTSSTTSTSSPSAPEAPPAPRTRPARPGERVVIYTALDELYSAPLLKKFEDRTGIQVDAVYDSEAAKTVGLVNRLIAERDRPRCDVFWNNEIIRTIKLHKEGLLDPYKSPQARSIPDGFKNADGYWTGFAARARVLVFNTKLVAPADVPPSVTNLVEPEWRGKVGMAYPLFGSTATHAAALFSRWGDDKAKKFFADLKANDVKILDGNMTVCRAVAGGELALGLTDTDDAHLLKGEGKPIDFRLIAHEGDGAILIPNTVALIKNAPNPSGGRDLIDFILSPEVEAELAASPSAQIPLHPDVAMPADVRAMAEERFLKPNYADAESKLQSSADFLKEVFAKP